MRSSAIVSVPASSGNLGPGFDVLGLALDYHNQLRVRVLSGAGAHVVSILGEGERSLPRDGRNMIIRIMAGVFKRAGRRMPRLSIECQNRIPLARGLGSSSAAFLSALLAANRLIGDRFSRAEILDWATRLEGHPDNVAPALLGGVKASAVVGGHVVVADLPLPRFKAVVAIPDFELATKRARAVLPAKIPMRDAVWNLSAVALMGHALDGDGALLRELLNDRWHEPYRAKLIPGFNAVKRAAIQAGANGVILSGAGPTMLAFSMGKDAARIAAAMKNAFSKNKVEARTMVLAVDRKGAVIR